MRAPGFARAFPPVFLRGVRQSLPPKRALLLGLALAVPALLALVIHDRSPEGRGTGLVGIVVLLYLNLLVPLTGLVFGTAVIEEEAGAGNLPFLFTRPAPRSATVLGRYAACLVVGGTALGASLAATLVASAGAEPPPGFGGRAVLAVAFAYPAYLAIFTVLSGFTRWALIGGLLYTMGLEGVLALIPGMVRKATMLYYSRSLVGEWEGRRVNAATLFGPEGPVSPGASIAVLLGVAGVALALAVFTVSRRQYATRNAGRA